jgi:hypothetical protein
VRRFSTVKASACKLPSETVVRNGKAAQLVCLSLLLAVAALVFRIVSAL